jgi:hypothetical protein
VDVPADAADGDGAVQGGERQPRYAAGGGERGGARPAPKRRAGLRQVTGVQRVGYAAQRGVLRPVAAPRPQLDASDITFEEFSPTAHTKDTGISQLDLPACVTLE